MSVRRKGSAAAFRELAQSPANVDSNALCFSQSSTSCCNASLFCQTGTTGPRTACDPCSWLFASRMGKHSRLAVVDPCKGDSFFLQKADDSESLNRRCSRDEGELIHEIFASEGGDSNLIPLPSGSGATQNCVPLPLLTSTPLQRSKFLSSRIQLSKARRNEIIERLNKLRSSE